GDDRVRDLRRHALALAHPVADHLPAAELHLLAVDGEILLDLDPQLRVREAHAIARGGTEHLRIGRARNLRHFSDPITLPWNPKTLRSPASATSFTVRFCPGSKRTAVPAAMLSRKPRDFARSKRSASFVSKK